MSEARKSMVKALNSVVVSALRELGFGGSFPHLRRIRNTIDLLTFQFDRDGGGFIIELGRCGADGFTTPWGKHITPEKVRAWDVYERIRVQPREGSSTGSWFRFDYARSSNDFTLVAETVLPFVELIEDVFRDFDHALKLRKEQERVSDPTPPLPEPDLEQDSFDL